MPRRTLEQVHADEIAHDAVHSRLRVIRNSWYFANVYQFIFLFGSELKIDNEIDIDVFEEECLKPEPSHILAEIGLCLLKWVSSHRGLTFEIFEEYTRRQYLAKAPELNPFGDNEEPIKFRDLDLFIKLKILHQLSVWVFWNPDRMREKTHETDQTQWRMDPLGYDSKARPYYVLDDNRLYRITFPTTRPSTAKKPESKINSANVSRRSSKRQKMANGAAAADAEPDSAGEQETFEANEGLGGAMWECLAVTLEEYQSIVDRLRKSKHPGEKDIVFSLREDVLPELERAAESRKRKHAQRMRDMENLQRLATAKRSSRIAGKAEKQREEDEHLAAEEKRAQDLAMAHAEQERQQKLDEARESRMQTREQRLKDREVRRILHEEELERLERGESIEGDGSRVSERNRKSQMEQKQRDIDALRRETVDDEWYFDCSGCGAVGKNFEDNKDAIACEKCGVWQHSACHGIKPDEASREDYQFICHHCANYPNGVRINVKQAAKTSSSSKSRKSSKPTKVSQSSPKAHDADKAQKRGPGRPRKQESGGAAVDYSTAQAYDAQSLTPRGPGTTSDGVLVNGLPGQPQINALSGGLYYDTLLVGQAPTKTSTLASTYLPTTQPKDGSSSFHQARVSNHGHSVLQSNTVLGVRSEDGAFAISNPAAAGIEQYSGNASKTPLAKPSSILQEKPVTPGQAIASLTPSYGRKDAAVLLQGTPGPANPVDGPSSAASTRFVPSPQSGSNAAMSGKSPTKHYLNSPSSSFGGGALSSQQGNLNTMEDSNSQQASTPAKGSMPALAPAPVLSPSVNTGPPNGQTPIKKPTPMKAAEVEAALSESAKAAAPPSASETSVVVPPREPGHTRT